VKVLKPPDEGALVANTSYLRTAYGKRRCERIKQLDKIEEPLLWLERLRRRQPTLLRLVLVIDLLDLAAVDPQPPWWQDMTCYLVSQTCQQSHCFLLWLHGEGK
jgi:hypothetical protein